MVCPLLVLGSHASLTGFWALFWAVFENAVACLVLAIFCPLPPINSDLLPLAAGAAVWPALVSLVFRLGAGDLRGSRSGLVLGVAKTDSTPLSGALGGLVSRLGRETGPASPPDLRPRPALWPGAGKRAPLLVQ